MKRHVTCIGRLVPACEFLGTLGLLTGCASQQATYEKPGVSEADRTVPKVPCGTKVRPVRPDGCLVASSRSGVALDSS